MDSFTDENGRQIKPSHLRDREPPIACDQLLDDYLTKHPDAQKRLAIFCLRYGFGWTFRDIADAIGSNHGHCQRLCVQVENEINNQFGHQTIREMRQRFHYIGKHRISKIHADAKQSS